jgi:hypothetical protein
MRKTFLYMAKIGHLGENLIFWPLEPKNDRKNSQHVFLHIVTHTEHKNICWLLLPLNAHEST